MPAKYRGYGSLSEEEFMALFLVTTNVALAHMTGLAVTTVIKRARRLGLRKSKEHVVHTLSAAHRGKPLSDEHKRAISESHKASPRVRRGAAHPCWKGGYNDRRHRTTEGRAWQAAVLARDDWTCQDCRVRFGKKSRGMLEAHHVLDWVTYPALREDVANGLTLCHPCHWIRHGYQARGPEMKACDCGCGREMVAYDSQGRLRHYLKNHSPKHRAAFSRRAKGRVFSAETRAKMSAARQGKKASPEACAKASAVRKGKPHSPEHTAAITKALRERSPEQKALTAQRQSQARKKALAEGRCVMPSRWAKPQGGATAQ